MMILKIRLLFFFHYQHPVLALGSAKVVLQSSRLLVFLGFLSPVECGPVCV